MHKSFTDKNMEGSKQSGNNNIHSYVYNKLNKKQIQFIIS